MARKSAVPAAPPVLLDVYRFRDQVAVYAAARDGGTLYLVEDDARRFALAILAACDSIKAEAFALSNVPPFTLTTATIAKPEKGN